MTTPEAGNPAPSGDQPTNNTPQPGQWFDSFQDADLKGWVQSVNLPSPEMAAQKAYHLEKLLGADKASRALIPPKDDASPEEKAQFWRKLGAAEKPDDYKIPEQFASDEIMSKFRDHAHTMNMPTGMFDEVMKWYGGVAGEIQQKGVEQASIQSEKEWRELEQEWNGQGEFDKNTELARRASRTFIPHGKPEELENILTRMEGALGTKFTMKLWSEIGKMMTEHNYVGPNNNPASGMSPEAARFRINELKKDQAWGDRYAKGGTPEKEEWDKLHRIAYGQQG